MFLRRYYRDPVSWWFYSGITHANPFAFMQFVGSDQALPSGMPGLLNAPLYIDGRQFVMATATLGRATINAATAFALLMGADTTAIEKAERGFSESVRGALAHTFQ